LNSPLTSLPPGGGAELTLSVERAYREAVVLDRLGALWSLILAKCLLAQWAIATYSIPVSGLAYVWSLSVLMAAMASALYLRANRLPLSVIPETRRVGGFVLYARFALGAFSSAVAAGICAALAGAWSLARASIRRAWEPFAGALLWWGLAGTALRSPDSEALLWSGLGWLLASALPSFALSLRAVRRPAAQA
jgi:hypothetical protein